MDARCHFLETTVPRCHFLETTVPRCHFLETTVPRCHLSEHSAMKPVTQAERDAWSKELKLSDVPVVTKSDVMNAYKQLALERHPDKGGSNEMMASLIEARQLALRDLEVSGGRVRPRRKVATGLEIAFAAIERHMEAARNKLFKEGFVPPVAPRAGSTNMEKAGETPSGADSPEVEIAPPRPVPPNNNLSHKDRVIIHLWRKSCSKTRRVSGHVYKKSTEVSLADVEDLITNGFVSFQRPKKPFSGLNIKNRMVHYVSRLDTAA